MARRAPGSAGREHLPCRPTGRRVPDTESAVSLEFLPIAEVRCWPRFARIVPAHRRTSMRTTLVLGVMAALVALAGCVSGEPFEPEAACRVVLSVVPDADSLVVKVDSVGCEGLRVVTR